MAAADPFKQLKEEIKQAIADGFDAVAAAQGKVGDKVNSGFKQLGIDDETLERLKNAGGGLAQLGASVFALEKGSELLNANLGFIEDSLVGVGLEAKNAAISFNQATGFGGEFDSSIMQIRDSLKGFPVDAQNVSQSVLALSRGFTDFTLGGIQPAEQRIAQTITILNKLGASIENQTTIVQGLRKGFSQTDEQIDMSLREFEALADTLNIDVGTVMSNFATQIPLFGAFGDSAVSAFKRLQAQSKGTGLELNKLVQMSEKFTTFEGAASTIGQLNQLLGDTGLLPTDLVQAALEDPAKAIELLQGSLSGFDVENMGGGLKRVLADLLGFGSDITGFISFARGGTDALSELQMQAAKTDTELLQSIQKGTDPATMAQAMARLGVSVDGIGQAFSKVEDIGFSNAITGAINLRKEVDELTKGVNAEDGLAEFFKMMDNTMKNLGVQGSATELFGDFKQVLSDTTAIDERIARERQELKTTLTESLSNIQVHVYLDRSQLAQEIGALITSGGQ